MSRALTLTIPQPCSESWAAMTPAAQGRHCAACQKTVVDFSRMSDAEVLAYLAKPGQASGCGRFLASQLERRLLPPQNTNATRWRSWLMAAVALWGLRETAGSEAKGQTRTEQRAVSAGSPLDYSIKPDYEGIPGPRVLRGTVVDSSTSEGLPGVSIFLQGTTIGTSSDSDGKFSLVLPPGTKPVVIINYLGYLPQSVVPLEQAYQDGPGIRVALLVDPTLAGEVIMTGGYHRRAWPWHPREFYYWAKYQLSRPFQR